MAVRLARCFACSARRAAYYFPREERAPLYRQLSDMLGDRGQPFWPLPPLLALAALGYVFTQQTRLLRRTGR